MSGFTVMTTMKNESAFLLERVAHHNALRLAQHHPTKHWPATSIHRSALKQATRCPIVQNADWIWVCNADEFLTIKASDSTMQALAALKTASDDTPLWHTLSQKISQRGAA